MNNEMMSIHFRLYGDGDVCSLIELNAYKVKLENFFSETDDNTEKCDLLKMLLWIDKLYTQLYGEVSFGPWGPNCSDISDDQERYIQMGLKIKPNDPSFNFWNE